MTQSRETLDEYANDLLGGEPDLLRSMRAEAEREDLPTIQVPLEVGRLLSVAIETTRARRVLEIGTLFGYSSVLMAGALPVDGIIVTLEANPRHARVAQSNFERAGLADRIRVLEGPAVESLARLESEGAFDVIFIDADKVSYSDYLDWALRLSRPGTIIIADNVWRDGSVAGGGTDEASTAIARFNQRLASETRLVTAFVPTRGGADGASVSVVRA